MTAINYRDLIAWQKAFELTITIYKETASFPKEEKYGITSQLRKAAVSITSNIAEGEGRGSANEFRHLKRRIVVCSTQKSYREDDVTEMAPLEDFFRALWQGDIL
jgi:hypothetical protein